MYSGLLDTRSITHADESLWGELEVYENDIEKYAHIVILW